MSNNLSVLDMIAARALKRAHEKATFIGTIDRQFDESYSQTSAGGNKNGPTLRVRNPNKYTRRQGSRVMDVQDQDESTQTITVATQDGVDMRFNSAELSQSIDLIDERYIKPAMDVLVSGIDSDCIIQATKDTYNVVGTPGTVVGASGDLEALYNARGKLNQYLAPKDSNRALQVDSITMAKIVNGNKNIFNPTAAVSEAFREGFYSRSAMADFYENERTWTMTNGDDVAGEIDESQNTNFVEGANKLHIDGLGTGTITVGQVFDIEGIYAVHPETKQAYSHKQQFVVTEVATIGSNEADIYFSPPIYTTGAKKNVATSTGADLTWTAVGQDGKDVTFWGSANTGYRQNLMYHKNAFAFVTAELPIMGDAAKCVRMTHDGLSIRVWEGSDIRNDELLIRLDILWGFKSLRPEWACRVSN